MSRSADQDAISLLRRPPGWEAAEIKTSAAWSKTSISKEPAFCSLCARTPHTASKTTLSTSPSMLGRSRCCAPSNLLRRAAPAAAESRAGSPVAHTLPRQLQTPQKLGCGMVFKPHWCFLEQMPAMSRYPARSSRRPPSLPLSLSPSLSLPLSSLSRSPPLSLAVSLSLSLSHSLFSQVMTTPAESPLAPSSGSSLLAIASSTPSSGPGPAQASKPGLAQPSPPTPRRTNPKTWLQKKTFSVKTFRSKRFGQNVSVRTFRSKLSVKTFGQNLLAPKPLTISINP